MAPVVISPLRPQGVNPFFESVDVSNDTKHVQEYISLTHETAACYQTIIHKAYCTEQKNIFGFCALRTTYDDVDGVPGMLVEFLYVKPEYRNTQEKTSQVKYSFLLLDYIVEEAIKIQKLIAINHVYLVPINDKVRKVYEEYGFENIPGSGSNEYEDYMVFNLLDEDPTIM
ncbi:MAG: hypothetical protein ABFR02_10960 [Campylobacterota bacterium]